MINLFFEYKNMSINLSKKKRMQIFFLIFIFISFWLFFVSNEEIQLKKKRNAKQKILLRQTKEKKQTNQTINNKKRVDSRIIVNLFEKSIFPQDINYQSVKMSKCASVCFQIIKIWAGRLCFFFLMATLSINIFSLSQKM